MSEYSKYEIAYIRHGETDFNEALNSSNNPEKIRCDEKFIDCSLNDKGLSQVESLSKNLKNFEIGYIFCSPLNRCLETAYQSLKAHPKRHELKVIVHPLLTEVINSIHDISASIRTEREFFNENSEIKFDWSYFDLYYRKKEQETFFLNFIKSNEDVDAESFIKNILDDGDKKELYSQMLALFIKNNRRPESLLNLYNRTQEFKKFLKNFLSQSCQGSVINEEQKQIIQKEEFLKRESIKNVLVFTHSGFIRMSTAVIPGNTLELENYPENCYKPKNCEIVAIDLNNI